MAKKQATTGDPNERGSWRRKYANADALQEKCDEYFAKCDAEGKLYGEAGLALHLGVKIGTMRGWYDGTDCADLQEPVQRAYLRIQAQLEELRELRRTIEAYKAKETVGEIDRILFGSHNVDGLKVITASVPNADTGRLRQMGDVLRDKDASVVAVLATVNEGKITFLAVCGKDAIARGIKAGDLVKQVCCCCGGSGGGKPDSAMGGGKDVTKVDNALAIVDDYVVSKLK